MLLTRRGSAYKGVQDVRDVSLSPVDETISKAAFGNPVRAGVKSIWDFASGQIPS